MKNIQAVLLWIAISFVAVTPMLAETITVGSDGPPTYDYATIQAAIDAANPGDIVFVSVGTYYENIILKEDEVQLLGAGADVTTIDGGGSGFAISNCYDHYDCIDINSFIIDGFTIKNHNANAIYHYSKKWSASGVSGIITNNIIKDSAYGITPYGNCSLEITNNLIYNNRNSRNTDGVGVSIMWGGYADASSKIYNNTIVGNCHGIWVYDANATIINNIVVNNSGGQNVESTGINHHGGGTVYISYNDVYGNDVNYRAGASPGSGDISADPLFVDHSTGDYHLLIDSSCIDAGDPSADYINEPDPRGCRINMGAYGNTTEATISSDPDVDGIYGACDECTDTDGDGYGNPGFPHNTCPLDNCPVNYNPDQADFDGDGLGDVCDPRGILNIGSQWANCGDVGVKIDICLENLNDPVGGFQMDLCENPLRECAGTTIACVDDDDCLGTVTGEPYDVPCMTTGAEPNCLTCVECEMTERTVLFDCVVNELDDGCCRVILFSKNPGGLINPGECDIVTIVYEISDDPECCDECIPIDAMNIIVTNEYGYDILGVIGELGSVCPYTCGDLEPGNAYGCAGDIEQPCDDDLDCTSPDTCDEIENTCGDGDVDIFDILQEVNFVLEIDVPDDCQAGARSNVPTGTPPYCDPPNGNCSTSTVVCVTDDDCMFPGDDCLTNLPSQINIQDVMVIIDMALDRQDCCTFYYTGVIY